MNQVNRELFRRLLERNQRHDAIRELLKACKRAGNPEASLSAIAAARGINPSTITRLLRQEGGAFSRSIGIEVWSDIARLTGLPEEELRGEQAV